MDVVIDLGSLGTLAWARLAAISVSVVKCQKPPIINKV